MTFDRFNKVVEEQLNTCSNLITAKGESDYVIGSQDRLIQFKTAASLQKNTPKQALLGMMTKHVTSLYDMVADNGDYPIEKWEEKITDLMNYCLLLKGLVVEEKDSKLVCRGSLVPDIEDVNDHVMGIIYTPNK